MVVFFKKYLRNCRYFIFKIFKNLRWRLLELFQFLKTANENIFNMHKCAYIALVFSLMCKHSFYLLIFIYSKSEKCCYWISIIQAQKLCFPINAFQKKLYHSALTLNISKVFLNYKNLNKDNNFQLYDNLK